MSRRYFTNIVLVSELAARLDRALNLLAQLVCEVEGTRSNWQFLQSRLTDLQTRIAGICEDAQVVTFEQHGYYLPPKAVLAKIKLKKEKPEGQRAAVQRKRAEAARAELAAAALGAA